MKEYPRSYVVFDTETTGLSNQDRIIEISAIRVRNGGIEATFSELINPEQEISPKITRLTGITNIELACARLASEVLPEFLEFIGDLPLVAQNAEFDVRMINNELHRSGSATYICLDRNDIDTMLLARELFPCWQSHSLEALCAKFNIRNESAHRSLSDARATMQCFEALIHGSPIEDSPEDDDNCIGAISLTGYVEVLKPNLQGLSFCITGDPRSMDKDTANTLIEQRDGIVKTSVSSKLDYLVNCFAECGYESGKLAKAKALIEQGKHIRVITENEFLAIIGVYREDDTEGIAAALADTQSQADGDGFPCTTEDIDRLYKERLLDPRYDGYQNNEFTRILGSNKRISYYFYSEKAFEFKPGPHGKARLYLPESIMRVMYPEVEEWNKYTYYPVDRLTDKQMDQLCSLLRARKEQAFRSLGESFGCCNDHVNCSDQKSCLHKTDPFYNGCTYRRNLEEGRIFYGKNRNV